MSKPLKKWDRPHYQHTRGKALLYYVVFGKVEQPLELSASRYHLDEIPEALDLRALNADAHGPKLKSFKSPDYFAWTTLQRKDPKLAGLIDAQKNCTIVRGTFSDSDSLNYLRNTLGLLACMIDHGGVAVFDLQIFSWLSGKAWKKRFFRPEFNAIDHVLVMSSPNDDGTEWFHTRGMRKFGKPDLSVPATSRKHREAVIDMIHRFVEFQALGGVIANGEAIRMKSLPAGMTCHRGGSQEDPDFNNSHVEIRWAKQT